MPKQLTKSKKIFICVKLENKAVIIDEFDIKYREQNVINYSKVYSKKSIKLYC